MRRRWLLNLAVAIATFNSARAQVIPFGFWGAGGPITRNIATNVRAPGWQGGLVSNGYSSSTTGWNTTPGTYTYGNTRQPHVNQSGAAVSALQLVFSNWLTTPTTEADNPNAITVAASVEYPAGTLNQVTWSAATSVAIASGAEPISDLIALSTTIPDGATFWTNTNVSVASGGIWPICGGAAGPPSYQSVATAGYCEVGTGANVNKTMSGTVTSTYNAGYWPSAILATSSTFKKVAVALVGDSITLGAADGNFSSYQNTGLFGRGCDGVASCATMAVTGTTASAQIGNLTRRLRLLAKINATHIICGWGFNDIVANPTLATVQANLASVWAALAAVGSKIVQSTITPQDTTTDHFSTSGNQTPTAGTGFTGGASSIRAQLNAVIRTLPSPLADYIEVADAIEGGRNLGVFRSGTGTHSTGYAITGAVTSGSTVTSINTNLTLTANRYNYGYMVFTSGVCVGQNDQGAGLGKQINGNPTTGGVVPLKSGMPTAPSAGDTFVLLAATDVNTTDGTHPQVTSTSSPGYGGVFYGADAVAAKVSTWATTG